MSPPVNLPLWSPRRPWGFRFSRGDLVVILVGTCVSVMAAASFPDLAVLLPFVLGHFFLFCNVFRVGEARELIWSGVFLVNVAVGALSGEISWWVVLPLQCAPTLVVILRTLRSGDYHGIACQRINPLGYRSMACRKALAWSATPTSLPRKRESRRGMDTDCGTAGFPPSRE